MVRRTDPVRAYVTIIEGCNDHCAFCVVPYTRGHERMRAKADILADVREAVASGRREVQLLGQIVNHYSAPDDPSCDFAQLLSEVDAIPGVERIRFASPHPRHTGTRLIEAVRDLPQVCKHFHLPVQSGSSRDPSARCGGVIPERSISIWSHEIRESIPGVTLSTDMIVGFPGETTADFEETLSLTEAAQYHSMFSFKYSPRPNTLASKRMADDVSAEDKTARIVALQELQRSIQTRLHEQAVGTDGRCPGRLGEPPTQPGTVGTNIGEHGSEFADAVRYFRERGGRRLDWSNGHCSDHAVGAAQSVG